MFNKKDPPKTGNDISTRDVTDSKLTGRDDKSVTLIQGVEGETVASIVKTLTDAHTRQIAGYEQQISALTQTVQSLVAQAAGPGGDPAATAALTDLSDGRLDTAEDYYQHMLDTELQNRELASHRAAEAARNLGALAFLHDTQTALAHYRTATDLDPDDPDGWNELGRLFRRLGRLPDALAAYEQVQVIGEIGRDPQILAIATGNKATIHFLQGNLTHAEELFKRTLSACEELEDREGMANALGNLGLIYGRWGDVTRAEEVHNRSLNICEEIGDLDGMSHDIGNLGLIYRRRGDLDKAREAHQRAFEINEELGSKEGMASDLGNLGIVHEELREFDHAIRLYSRALEIFRELGHQEGEAVNLGNIGKVKLKLGELEQAEQLFQKSLTINKKLGLKKGLADQNYNFGKLHAEKGGICTARESGERALELYREMGASRFVDEVRTWLDGLPPVGGDA